jgi:hypothetical protein
MGSRQYLVNSPSALRPVSSGDGIGDPSSPTRLLAEVTLSSDEKH